MAKKNSKADPRFVLYRYSVEYPIKRAKHNGKEHIVVPVVMMVEGVHHGSHGPILHAKEELGRFPGAWNGIPITVGHPKRGSEFIGANEPQVLDEQAVGRVYYTKMDGDRLKAEAWIDEERIKEVSPLALSYILEKRPLEVSVGVFTDDEPFNGRWRDEDYVAIAHNHRPEHLALLPDSTGACSWEDGAGIRVNQANNRRKFSMAKEEKIKVLLGMDNTPFKEDDPCLEAMSEEQLDAVIELAKRPIKAEAPQVNAAQVQEILSKEFSDQAKFLGLLPPNIREQVEHGMTLHQAHREQLITHITTHQATKDVWTKEELEKMDTKVIGKIAASIKEVVDYSAMGSPRPVVNQSTQEHLLPAGVVPKKDEKK